jgi:DNA repair exonuclease SbcCD ATPase subunit
VIPLAAGVMGLSTPEVSGYGALVLVALQFAWAAYKDVKGGGLKKSQAEAAKEALDTEAAAQALPHLQEAIRLGNWGEGMSVQQQLINGLQESLTAAAARERSSAERERLKDQRIDELEERVRARDERIDELERRLDEAEQHWAECERHLTEARSIISELRGSPDHTPTQE